MYGNGWPGRPRAGVRTGNIRSLEAVGRAALLGRSRSQSADISTPARPSSGTRWSTKAASRRSIISGTQASYRSQLLSRGPAVPGRLIDAGDQLVFERCNPDLEELVEVGRRNGTELCSLEQRDPRFGRKLQDPFVKRKPTQLTIQEPLIGSAPLRAVRSGQRKSDRRRRVGGARVSRRWPGRAVGSRPR